MNSAVLTNAQIEWREGVPYSTLFDDIYYSRTDGFEETRYTFIDGNNLIQRWQQQPTHNTHTTIEQQQINRPFVISELGFGTGLNFLSTLYHWHHYGPGNRWLEYHSVEKFPLKLEDLVKAKSGWPQFAQLGNELIEHYPLPFKGIYQIVFAQQKVRLFLYWMDIKEAIAHWQQQPKMNVDAWFLDGFAPAKNPELWAEEGFNCLSKHSALNATLATFTAAGFVRRGLQAEGWVMSKRKGFGSKREMLVGSFSPSENHTGAESNTIAAPWFRFPQQSSVAKTVAVIGAGIAGCTTARYLAESGQKVTLFEELDGAGKGASGNSAGIFYPFLSADLNSTTQIFLQAYHRTLHDLDRFDLGSCVKSIGMINLTESLTQRNRLLKHLHGDPELSRWFLAADADQVHRAFKSVTDRVGVAFPKSGYLQPAAVCQKLTQHPDIHCEYNQQVISIKSVGYQWKLVLQDHEQTFDALVICNSFKAQKLLPPHFLPCIKVRGQTLELSLDGNQLQPPKTVICDQIYLIPLKDNALYVGATFERNDSNAHPSMKSQQELLDKLKQLTGCKIDPSSVINSRVGFRLCSVDRLPFVGPVPVLNDYIAQYEDLWQGKKSGHYPAASYWPNLYINAAHGARGITSSFLSAGLIAEYINQKPLSLPSPLAQLLHPARFLIREFKKPPEKRLPFVQQMTQELAHTRLE
jgi:tRNA 5-methylaminomethyl-2-thiouridine biosynthesis bifunctional protein